MFLKMWSKCALYKLTLIKDLYQEKQQKYTLLFRFTFVYRSFVWRCFSSFFSPYVSQILGSAGRTGLLFHLWRTCAESFAYQAAAFHLDNAEEMLQAWDHLLKFLPWFLLRKCSRPEIIFSNSSSIYLLKKKFNVFSHFHMILSY